VFRCQRTDAPAFRTAVLGALLAAAIGCSTQQAAHASKEAVKNENWDAAVYNYLELVSKEPENLEYRMGLRRARQNAANVHFQRGMALREAGRVVEARDEIQMAVQLDPTNQFAEQVLETLDKEIEILSGPGGRVELEEMKRQAREAKVKPPILDPASKEPVTLVFPQPKPVKEIYDAIGKAYGFTAISTPEGRPAPIELRDVTSERRSRSSCRPPATSTRCSTPRRSWSPRTTRRTGATTRTWSSRPSSCPTPTSRRWTSCCGP
jgi:general secretion pathway protein D